MRIEDIDFLIIGAAKSATTWLQNSLQQDPTVYMPDPELHYFSRSFNKGQAWYLSQFECTASHTTIGEKSNSYLEEPGVAQRIKNVLPETKLIVQLRNPVDRAYSDYCMLFRRGEVGSDIERYLDPRRADGGRFLTGGHYFKQLSAYLDLYPREQILILFFEDVHSRPQEQLDSVHRFLDLKPYVKLMPVTGKIKDKTVPVISPNLKRAFGPLKPILSPFRNNPILRGIHARIAREIEYAPLSSDLCKRLIDYYAPEMERLGTVVGADLTNWLSNVRSVERTGGAKPAQASVRS